MSEFQLQDKQRRVQQKIKLMLKNKKLQKLTTSQKDLVSQKPTSIYNQNINKRFDQFSTKPHKNIAQQNNYREQQLFDNLPNKRMKSTTTGDQLGTMGSISFKESLKKIKNSNKTLLFDNINQGIRKMPSVEKFQNGQSATSQIKQRPKRPSSVLHKPSSRTTTSRSRKITSKSQKNQKQIQDKIRQYIPKAFQYGIKLQKFTQQVRLNLTKQKQSLLSQQITILKLVNNCRLHFQQKLQNQQQDQRKLTAVVQKQIIEILKKKLQKLDVKNKCDSITTQISKLIQSRLSTLKTTKVIDL